VIEREDSGALSMEASKPSEVAADHENLRGYHLVGRQTLPSASADLSENLLLVNHLVGELCSRHQIEVPALVRLEEVFVVPDHDWNPQFQEAVGLAYKYEDGERKIELKKQDKGYNFLQWHIENRIEYWLEEMKNHEDIGDDACLTKAYEAAAELFGRERVKRYEDDPECDNFVTDRYSQLLDERDSIYETNLRQLPEIIDRLHLEQRRRVLQHEVLHATFLGSNCFHSCRGATQILQSIPIVKFLLVTPMCGVKLADIDIIEDFK
jgi:hypothetical protein